MKKFLTKPRLVFLAVCVALALVATALMPGALHQTLRESRMARVASTHYEVLYDPSNLPTSAAQNFVDRREPLVLALSRRLGVSASGVRIRIVFDPKLGIEDPLGLRRSYTVDATTIRTNQSNLSFVSTAPQLDPAADAEAFLHAAWGRPEDAEMSYWAALWLLGQRNGMELGMAAAEVEHRVGYQKVATLLTKASAAAPSGVTMTPQDRALLAAAWLNEVSAFGGVDSVHKLYAARVSNLDVTTATAALGTSPAEMERKWQLWLYSYMAGMPNASPKSGSMPNMPGMAMPSADASH